MPTRLRLAVLLAALWWGSLSAVALLVVPLLFHALPSPALAGGVAARLFSAQCWVALACGVALLLMLKGDAVSGAAPSARTGIVLVFLGLLLALLLEHGVAPRIVARHNLALWHGVGSAMVLAQWLASGLLLWALLPRPMMVAAGESPGHAGSPADTRLSPPSS